MRWRTFFAFCGAALVGLAAQAWAATPSTQEMKTQRAWLKSHFSRQAGKLPVSFAYAGQPSASRLRSWRVAQPRPSASAALNRHRLIWADPDTGLEVRLEGIEFCRHPVVEWVVYFKNTGAKDTPILQDIRALDTTVDAPAGGAAVHYAKGATCSMDDFQPLTQALGPGAKVHVQPGGGRSSSDFLPFFNLESGPRGGVILGLGWSGEWAADFTAEAPARIRLAAGLAETHLKLQPGEEIRTPRVALLFYEGDWVRGQNLWRRFVLEHHRPRVNGQPLQPPIFNGNWGGTPAASHLANIKAILAHDLPIDAYWIDAEWFGRGPWWANPGNWQVKQDLYPEGFKPLSDLLHQSGKRLLLWFEPERVCEGTPWAAELGRWLLALPKERRYYNWGDRHSFPDWVTSESRRNQIQEGDRLFNLALPAARQFLTDFISSRITEFGLDCYRHDANIAPLEFWRAADAPDRQGLTETHWVEGLYAFWDELLRRHPHLIIDNCASGGRRIDLETMSRSTPFWRTDFPGDPVGKQCHTYGVSFWAPLNSTGGVRLGRDSDYAWWSSVSSTIAFELFGNGDAPQGRPVPAEFPFAKARTTLQQYRALQPYFLGDYYPLTPYTQAADAWMAWQFDRPDLGAGLIQAFRRAKSPATAVQLRLQGLAANARYLLRRLGASPTEQVSGQDLMQAGLRVPINDQPGAAVIVYEKAPGQGPRRRQSR
jgi:alpha-galactosidase